MPSNWLLFDRIRALTKRNRIYQSERTIQDQPQLDRIITSGDLLDFNSQNALLDQTQIYINRLERYRDFDLMDQKGEISLALDLYCLSGNTRVPLLDGTCPTIKELTESGVEEFWLYGYDFETNKQKPVLGRNPHISGTNARLVRVSWNGGYINCTASHKFYTSRGWVCASDLIPGDDLTSINIKDTNHISSIVLKVEKLEGIANEVYDLYVDDGHAFAAGTSTSFVLVHNSDEGSLVDPERKKTLIIKARNKRLKKELENFFFNILRWDTFCRPTIRYLCKYGDCPFEIVPEANRNGVASLRFMDVYNFTRIETKYGDLVGFFYTDILGPKPQFLHPWQVMHIRLTSFEKYIHPYGKSILEGCRKPFKQLRLMEDAALIYRLTRSVDRRKFTIPVGLIPAKEIPEYMNMIARNFKRQRFYNPTTGTFDERYSPLISDDDYFLPKRPDGSGPDVETLPGGENVDKIQDIEYFKKMMISPLKIPFARVGLGEGSGEASEKSLSQSHSEFAKAVQWIQREVSCALTKPAIVHLALRGYTVEDLKGFEIALTATSAMEELYRIETWQTRTSVMDALKEIGWFPKEWIVTHFTDLSPDEIEELKDIEEESESSSLSGASPGGLDIPGMDDDLGDDDMNDDGDLSGIEAGVDDGSAAKPPGNQTPMDGLEGLDIKSQERLINEIKNSSKRKKRAKILNEWANRLNKNADNDNELNSGFDHYIDSKELDGLTKESYVNDSERGIKGIHNPNNNKDDLLVEWSDSEGRDNVIEEVYKLLNEGNPIGDARPENAPDNIGVIMEDNEDDDEMDLIVSNL